MKNLNFKPLAKPRIDQSFDILLPEDTCPVCGKKFIRRCRREDWGCYWRSEHGKRVLLCSLPCTDAYRHECERKAALKVGRTKTAQAWRLVQRGASSLEAARAVGMSEKAIYNALLKLERDKYDELQWLEAHNWEGIA